MSGNPIFSIITVTLNSEKYLTECFLSLKSQEFRDFELIVIDGGSTDGTLSIIHENAELVTFFLSEEDDGLYFAMNKGLSHSKGEFVGILNSDDRYFPWTLGAVAAQISKTPSAAVIYGDCIVGNDLNEVLRVPLHQLDRMMIPHPSSFVRRTALVETGSFNTSYKVAADYELMLRLRNMKEEFVYMDQPLSLLRSGGYSSEHQVRSILETVRLFSKYSNQNRYFICRYLAGSLTKVFLERLRNIRSKVAFPSKKL